MGERRSNLNHGMVKNFIISSLRRLAEALAEAGSRNLIGVALITLSFFAFQPAFAQDLNLDAVDSIDFFLQQEADEVRTQERGSLPLQPQQINPNFSGAPSPMAAPQPITGFNCAAHGGEGGQIDSTQDVLCVLNNIANWMFTFLLAFAVLFILYGAYLFLTAGSSPDNAQKARSQIIYAVVAITIGILAKSFELVIRSVLGA